MKPKFTLILELQDSGIKFCLAKDLNRKIQIESAGFIKQTENLSKQVRELLDLPGCNQAKLMISVSRQAFLMRFFSIPATRNNEIRQMLEFQLAKSIPHQLEDISWDFLVLEQKQNLSKVLVFILQNKVLEKILSVCQEVKRIPELVTITTSGLYAWAKYQGILDPKSAIAVISLGLGSAEFAVFTQKNIVFSRAFTYASETELMQAIAHSQEMFVQEFGQTVLSKTVFTGIECSSAVFSRSKPEGTYISGLRNILAAKNISNTDLAASLGMIIDPSQIQDFSSARLRQAQTVQKNKNIVKNFIFIGSQICLIAIFLLAGFFIYKTKQLKSLEQKLSGLKVDALGLDQLFDRVKILEKEFSAGPAKAQIIKAIISCLPSEAKLTSLEILSTGDFSLQGFCLSTTQAFDFANSLNQQPVLRQVSIKYVSKVQTQTQGQVEFSIFGSSKLNRKNK